MVLNLILAIISIIFIDIVVRIVNTLRYNYNIKKFNNLLKKYKDTNETDEKLKEKIDKLNTFITAFPIYHHM